MKDMTLAAFASAVNKGELECSLTLYTPAGIITGSTISGRGWWQAVAAQSDDAGANVGNVFRTIGSLIYPSDSEREVVAGASRGDEDDDEGEDLPDFIHLHHAVVMTTDGATLPSGEGALMRISLENVVGWTFGRLAPLGWTPPLAP